MLGLAEALRRIPRPLEKLLRFDAVSPIDGSLTEQKISANILSQYKTFATFPGLEVPREQDFQSTLRFSCVVVQRRQFDRKIIAPLDERRIRFQHSQARGRCGACAFQQLVLLIENARIFQSQFPCVAVCLYSALRIVLNVVVAKPEITPGGGKIRIELDR